MISFLAIPWKGGMKRGFGLYFVGGRVVEQSRSSEQPFLLISTLKNVSFSFSEDLRGRDHIPAVAYACPTTATSLQVCLGPPV